MDRRDVGRQPGRASGEEGRAHHSSSTKTSSRFLRTREHRDDEGEDGEGEDGRDRRFRKIIGIAAREDRRAGSGGVAPRRELDFPPRGRAATQVFEKLLVVGEDDELPVGEPIGEQLRQPPAMLDIEAVDHVVENQEPELFVEARCHCQEHRNRE